MPTNRTYLILSIVIIVSVIIGAAFAFVPINIDPDNTSTTTTETNTTKINETITITITNTTTLPVQVVTITITYENKSVSYITTTLPPNIVTITSTTTTIIQPQAITNIYVLGDNSTTTYTVHSTTTVTRTITTNTTVTTTKDWSISGAKISHPSLVESITFTFTNYDRLLQVGSYISFSADYETVVRAVMNENGIPNATSQITTGNVEIDGKLYQYSMFSYRDIVTGDLQYVIIATHFYPDFLRTYYILYKTSGISTLAEMKDYLGIFKIGI